MTKEALKLALEALELEDMACRYEKDPTPEHIAKAITALREALAEQPAQQEPVLGVVIREGLPTLLQERDIKPTDTRLYTTPPQRKTQPAQAPEIYNRWQETIAGIPVTFESEAEAKRFMEYHFANAGKPIEQPAQRTWVGLTDEEFQMIYDMGRTPAGMMEMAESKLKEKNFD